MPRERTIFFIRNDAFAVSSPSSLPHLGPLLGSCNDYRAVSVSRFCSKNGLLPFRDHDFASERLKTAETLCLPIYLYFSYVLELINRNNIRTRSRYAKHTSRVYKSN